MSPQKIPQINKSSDVNGIKLVEVIRLLGKLFKDPVYLFPIVLAILITTVMSVYAKIAKVTMTAIEFLILIFGIFVIILIVPPIYKWIDRRAQRSQAKQVPVSGDISGDIELVGRDRPNIWDGFTGIYDAFNAPWVLEMEGSTAKYVAIHKKRFRNKSLTKVRYLYFFDDPEKDWNTFWARFSRFVRFEAMVFLGLTKEQVTGAGFVELLASKIKREVKDPPLKKLNTYLVKKEVPQLTFFHGTKNNAKTVIVYFNVGPFMVRGLPNKMLYSTNSEFANRIGDYFEEEALQGTVEKLAGKQLFQYYMEILKKKPSIT